LKIKTWHVIAFIILLYLAYSGGYLNFNTSQSIIKTNTPAQNGVMVDKPLKISVIDPIAGQALASATVQIYDANGNLMETLTTDSSGQATTAMSYKSGSIIYAYVESGNTKLWQKITVPYMSQYDAQASSVNPVTIQAFTLGTYVIKVMDQFGNVYSSGGTLNFTTLGTNTVSLTIQIYNTQDNTGYKSSYDPLNKVHWDAVARLYATNPDFVVSGLTNSVDRGTTTYWLQQVPDQSLTRQKVGDQYTSTGVYTFTVTINKGGLSSTQTLNIDLMGYFDPNYFAQNGIGSNAQVSLATFTLNIAP